MGRKFELEGRADAVAVKGYRVSLGKDINGLKLTVVTTA